VVDVVSGTVVVVSGAVVVTGAVVVVVASDVVVGASPSEPPQAASISASALKDRVSCFMGSFPLVFWKYDERNLEPVPGEPYKCFRFPPAGAG
jgi:hypothetical protein